MLFGNNTCKNVANVKKQTRNKSIPIEPPEFDEAEK